METTPKNNRNDLVEGILKDFDFKQVEKVMRKLNWQWAGPGGLHFPDIKELKAAARELMLEAERFKGPVSINCGGFKVWKRGNGSLTLEFVITETTERPF